MEREFSDRFEQYAGYIPKNKYWGEIYINNNQDKLLLLIEKFFFILDKETEVNQYSQLHDRIIPIDSTIGYLKKLTKEIINQQEIVKNEDVAELCRVYSLFIMNKGFDANKDEILFPIISPKDFDDNSFACSLTFLLTKYMYKKKYFFLNNIEKLEFEEYLNKNTQKISLEKRVKILEIDKLEENLIVRKEMSKFIEWFAEVEDIDLDKFIYFFLKNEQRHFLETTLGMNFLSKGLKNEKNKRLFDYCCVMDTPMIFSYIKEEHKGSNLIREMLGSLPEGLFETDYYCFQKYKDKMGKISNSNPEMYQIYRSEQLINKLSKEDYNVRRKAKI